MTGGYQPLTRRWPGMVLAALVASSTAQAGDAAMRIHRYAEFNPASNHTQQLAASAVGSQRRNVSVYGKQLVLDLESNAQISAAVPGTTLLRGAVAGKPQSWARLTYTPSGTHGLIWDGEDMYAIEPSAEVRSALAVSLPTPRSDTVIFKLADTTLDLGAQYCGAEAGAAVAPTGLATYQALTADLTSSSNAAPSLLLELQAITDAAYRAQFSSDDAARNALLVRLNNIDGIFTAQMGLSIVAASVEINATDPMGLSSTTASGNLLTSLGNMRNASRVMGTYAATHLFTGRDLDGDTLGIAYIGNVCGSRYGASLSEVRNRGAWIDSLVAAHEIGHQLGAVHDGTGACAGTASQSYLMGAQINGSSELSQCSRDSIFATMQTASCLVPAELISVVASAEPALSPAPPDSAAGGGTWDYRWLSLALLIGLRRRFIATCPANGQSAR